MKILEVKALTFPEIKVIKYERFKDNRGYFTEVFRNSEFNNNSQTGFVKNKAFVQYNESFSKKDTIRGFHFQWNPYMGKLVRVIKGNIIDMVIDIRKNSPNFGKIIGYPMQTNSDNNYGEWIWIPPGFAHGIFYLEDTTIAYFCTSEYNPTSEASISPLASDIDWSLFDAQSKIEYQKIANSTQLISDKDKKGHTIANWNNNPNSNYFIFGNV